MHRRRSGQSSGRSLGQYVASTVHARAYTCMHGVTDTYVVSYIYISAGRHHIGIGVTPSPRDRPFSVRLAGPVVF